MKNNGKMCDVRSLTIHWNISEMVYYNLTKILINTTNYNFTWLFPSIYNRQIAYT